MESGHLWREINQALQARSRVSSWLELTSYQGSEVHFDICDGSDASHVNGLHLCMFIPVDEFNNIDEVFFCPETDVERVI